MLKSLKHSEIKFNNSNACYFDSAKLLLKFNAQNPDRADTMLHEIGHAIDYMPGSNDKHFRKFHSAKTPLTSGMTLNDTVKKEVKLSYDHIYNDIFRKFNEEVLCLASGDAGEKYITLNALAIEHKAIAARLRLRHFAWGSIPSKEDFKRDPLLAYDWQRCYQARAEAEAADHIHPAKDNLLKAIKE